MPRPNRVDPFGALCAVVQRGQMMGNRGGRFHKSSHSFGPRAWASRQWICCVCEFKGRQRDVWGRFYTELFFLDEVTALAAGHRPCFECRRDDARAFQAAFATIGMKVGEMDAILHAERLNGRIKRTYEAHAKSLPEGAMFAFGGQAYGIQDGAMRAWSFSGYGDRVEILAPTTVQVLTPPAIIMALRNGFKPRWHDSAK